VGTLWLGCGGAEAPSAAPRFELRVDSFGQLGEAVEVDEAMVRTAILDAVARSGAFVHPGEASAGVMPTRVRMGEVAGPGGGRALRVAFVARTPSDYQSILGAAVDATVELERSDGAWVPEEDAPVALTRGVAVMDAKVRLLQGHQPEALALTRSDDPEIVVLTLEHIARQRWRAAAERAVELLAHGDERVVEAAVDCLGAIGGPEHVGALVKHVRLADRDQAQRLYEALSQLGGDEAAGFLRFAARNEDDPALADVAANALERLVQRDRDGVPPVDAYGEASPLHRLRGHRP
jgi:hypothetical protein